MISKELLSEVLGCKVVFCSESDSYENNMFFTLEDESEFGEHINIYELAHKCKEWAMYNGYGIASSTDTNGVIVNGFSGIYKMTDPDDILIEEQAATEPEAIFKACEWILEQKDKQ